MAMTSVSNSVKRNGQSVILNDLRNLCIRTMAIDCTLMTFPVQQSMPDKIITMRAFL